MSNLVGDVKTESENQAIRLHFLAELEDLMVKYQVSTINVAWKFGTPFNELEKALQDDTPEENGQISIAENPPEVRPINSVIGTDSKKATPEKATFRRVGKHASQADIDFDEEALAEAQERPGPRTALDVLGGVVDAMDKEAESLTPSLDGDPED